MTETAAPVAGELFKALAQLQAELPKLGKGQTANTGTYSYKYADLADVSQEVLPRLGKLGLAFTAKPTLLDGKFVLAYSLVHASGEREDGIYPLQSNGTPQQMGSAITYARRYCLCAVTGVAPDDDDDDAAEAQRAARQSAGNAPAARPRQNGQQQQRRESQPADPEAQPFADEAHKAATAGEIEDIHRRAREAGKVKASIRNPASGRTGNLAVYLDWRRKHLAAAVQLDAEDPWAAKVDELGGTDDATAAIAEVLALLGEDKIDAARAGRIENAILARFPDANKELAAVS